MCYDVSYLTKKVKKYAEHIGETTSEIDKLEKQLEVFVKSEGPVYHTTAFDHRKLPVLTAEDPKNIQFYHWGLMPHFIKDLDQYQQRYSARYLNSRIETLFNETMFNDKLNRDLENPFYRSAVERRCIVMLDAYFDWHWQGKNSYNFLIRRKDDEPMFVAGIWRHWQSKSGAESRDTVSLITTDANTLCDRVHNKPKASEGPRQLAMMDDEMKHAWLNVDLTSEQLLKEVKVYPDSNLEAYPVKKLFEQHGKSRISLNDKECWEEKKFPELVFDKPNEDQMSLF
ncbi:MAG: hypothetical protein CMB80_34510 [Flammeovirgaceae bacterium]|mgnify:CR=1 FL=1|nr:hypothetical protein [Flammeovirgaceae bacterium]MBR09167.1 hypothetical protein [Rickettsiales bacterium]|tara:strand:+ start:4091 stop:4942 length:852 start_codon:yes stop_codon:yes gene_type:complete